MEQMSSPPPGQGGTASSAGEPVARSGLVTSPDQQLSCLTFVLRGQEMTVSL